MRCEWRRGGEREFVRAQSDRKHGRRAADLCVIYACNLFV